MPRKTDGMEFKLLPRPTKGDDGKPLLYVRPASNRKYDMQAVDDWATKYRYFHSGDMTRSVEGLIDVSSILMSDGARVETRMGSFVAKLRLKGDFTDPDSVTDEDVELAGIEFIPSRYFIERLRENIYAGFRRWKDPIERTPIETNDQLEEALRKSMRRGYVTIKLFAYYAGLKYHTAKRLLDGLCQGENPRFRKRKEGNTNLYIPIVK